MRISIMLPFIPRRFSSTHPFADVVSEGRAARLWQGQSLVAEPHHVGVDLAAAGRRIPLGIGVGLMPLRHPFEAALQVRSAALALGVDIIAGYGPASRSFQRSLRGAPYASPLTAAAEYAGIVRALLDGETVDVDGEYFCMHGALPPAAAPRVAVGLGVLREGMARVAGEVADAAITWLTPPHYLTDVVLPALDEGGAGRRPRPRVVSMVPVAVARRGTSGPEVALSSNRPHLTLPHYRSMLRRAGMAVSDAATPDDAALLIDGGSFLYGEVPDIADGIARYAAAGVDELVLNVTGVMNTSGPHAALADLRAITEAVGGATFAGARIGARAGV